MQQSLGTFFSEYIGKNSIFVSKGILQTGHLPENLLHRDEQINNLAMMLAPTLRKEKPSNIFIYGKSGTGKTVTVRYVCKELERIASSKNIPMRIIYLNCKLKRVADTEYRLIAELARAFNTPVPATGLPTDEVYRIFVHSVQKENKPVILVLDEIDQLVKKIGDGFLYSLTRLNEDLQHNTISIVGISNDLIFVDFLDSRIRSSLSEEEIIFPPYNAMQLQDILFLRASLALKENSIEEGVIEKCAAYAAREHGDARRALELLRVAAEIAERNGFAQLSVRHIDEAEEKIEKDRVVEILSTQPKQFQAVLYSVMSYPKKTTSQKLYTGDIYELYRHVCKRAGLKSLTQRRISDILGELDTLGIVTARIISKGRHGRTRELHLATPQQLNPKIKQIIEDSLDL
ncbi:MAG: AAA family ATPase [Nanoarchaeota archaeon]|nr:MAG: AAA family ATPase [Nanoarchaeota archaeon]